MNKYLVSLDGISRDDFLRALGFKDEDFIPDPEGNPTKVWVTTSLSMTDLLEMDGVEDVVDAIEEKQKEIENLVGESLEDMGITDEHLEEYDL